VIDLAIIAIIVFCGWRGYRNGLIRGVFGVVTLIASLIIANIAASAYSEEVTGVLKPFISGMVDSTLTEIIDQGAEYEPVEHENNTKEFRTAYTTLRRIGLPESAAINISERVADDDTEGFLSDLISNKLSSILAFVALFGIAFLLMAIIFTVVGNLINFVFSLPGLKLIDIITGVAFGLMKGLLIVMSIATVVRYFGLLAISTVEKTSVLNYFVNNNAIANMLGI
jgi:uncharacterized membrane protein required for colicin V production